MSIVACVYIYWYEKADILKEDKKNGDCSLTLENIREVNNADSNALSSVT